MPPESAPDTLPFAVELIVNVVPSATFAEIFTAPVSVTGVPDQPEDAGPVPVTLIAPVPALAVKAVRPYQSPDLAREILRLIVPLLALVSKARVLPCEVCPTSPDRVIDEAVNVVFDTTLIPDERLPGSLAV